MKNKKTIGRIAAVCAGGAAIWSLLNIIPFLVKKNRLQNKIDLEDDKTTYNELQDELDDLCTIRGFMTAIFKSKQK